MLLTVIYVRHPFNENELITKLPCRCNRAYHANCMAQSYSCGSCSYQKKPYIKLQSLNFSEVKQSIRKHLDNNPNASPLSPYSSNSTVSTSQAGSNLTIDDFDDISDRCGRCNIPFIENDEVAKFSCNCQYAYHAACMKTYIHPCKGLYYQHDAKKPTFSFRFGDIKIDQQSIAIQPTTLTPDSFENIISHYCGSCGKDFNNNDLITKYDCHCQFAFHKECCKFGHKCRSKQFSYDPSKPLICYKFEEIEKAKKDKQTYGWIIDKPTPIIEAGCISSQRSPSSYSPSLNSSANSNIAIRPSKTKPDFSQITVHFCGRCFAQFKDLELIGKYSCSCTQAYHVKCLLDSKNPTTCTFCRRGKALVNLADPSESALYTQVKDSMATPPPPPAVSTLPAIYRSSATTSNSNSYANQNSAITGYDLSEEDFANISDHKLAKCSSCTCTFQRYDSVTKFPCKCSAVYHDFCLDQIQTTSTGDPKKCPTCEAKVSITYSNLPRVEFQKIQKYRADNKLKAHAVTGSNNPMLGTVAQFLSAFILGLGAEHLWSSKDMSKIKKGLGFGMLGCSFVALQNLFTLRRLKPSDNLVKDVGAWAAGTSLGFAMPMLMKKLENKQ